MGNRVFGNVLLAVCLAIGAAGFGGPVALAEDVKVPVTAQDHQDLAKVYREKVETYRKEVDFHRKMFDAYKAQAAPVGKGGQNPWVKKMQKHCQMLMKDAEKLAADAQKSVEFHELRAKELQGK